MLHQDTAYIEHLKELHSSEYEMASGEPDIRNWKVVGLQNREVGKVEELLFNEVSHRVRYLIVNINGKPLNLIS
ncbi:MAG TPA: PRC-barrel domain-containing protein, partial [Chitinophagaceae bacterium]